MAYAGITHVAIRGESLPQAEQYYGELFGLDVAYREADTEDGWRTLPDDYDWEQAKAAGIAPGMSLLFAGGFRMALEQTSDVRSAGWLDHVGLLVSGADLAGIRERARRLGCDVSVDRDTLIVIQDRHGIGWEVTTTVQANPRLESHGVRLGRWVDLPVRPKGRR